MPAAILRRVRELAGNPQPPLSCAIAWSGGLDSTVLVHALLAARRVAGRQLRLRALHVDHGLQPAAREFRAHCQRLAGRWHLPLRVLRLAIKVQRGASPEETARDARRAALAAALAPGEYLLTAQHADDQLETVLIALLRGAGPQGLAGMPAVGTQGGARVLRPLLEYERAGLLAYARTAGLEWVEDPTNTALRFDRNYLRARVVPALRERWPAAARTVARSARHAAAAAAQLAATATHDLALAADGASLDIATLRRLGPPRRAAVLRAFIVRAGARAPNERHLREIDAMLAARPDAHPLLRLPDCSLRRAGGLLHVETSD